MHGLTKVLIVIAAVLSIFLSAMVIAYAANTDRIRSDYARSVTEKEAATAALQTGNSQWGTAKAALESELSALRNEVATKVQAINSLELERANLSTERARAEQSRDAVEAKIKELSESVKTMQTLIATYSDEVRTLRKSEYEAKRRSVELEQRLADLESQNGVLNANNRALKEQLADAQRALGNAQSGVASLGETAGQAFEAVNLIQGRVEEVTREDSSGKTLVRMSMGSASGVAKNMKLYVVRGQDWVANLVVVQPDLRTSIATIELAASGADVRVGDLVISKLR